MYIKLLIIIFFSFLFGNNCLGQELVTKINVENVNFITTDDVGNLYSIGKDRSIKKYSKNGDSIQDYRIIKNGSIDIVDVSNSLDLFVLQSKFNRLTILDKMFSPMLELDMKQMGIYNSSAIGQSRDGNFWIYDNINQKLIRMDRRLNRLLESNDFRMADGTSINPVQLVEKNDYVILTDPNQGVFVFDRFGTFLLKLEILDVSNFQIINDQIVYLQEGKINFYNLNSKNINSMQVDIPSLSKAKQARIERERIYLLTNDGIEIYTFKPE